MQAVNPSGVPVLISPQPVGFYRDKPDANTRNRLFKASIALGLLQIVFGIGASCINAVSIHAWKTAELITYSTGLIGYGIWIGIVFVVTGSFGIVGGVRKNRCSMITFNILSIISASLTAPFLIVSAISAVWEFDSLCYQYVTRYYNHTIAHIQDLTHAQRFVAIMDTLMVFVAVLEAIASICSSVICCIIGPCSCDCDAGCCCSADNYSTEAVVTGHELQSSLQKFTKSGVPNRPETSVTANQQPINCPQCPENVQCLQLIPNERYEALTPGLLSGETYEEIKR